MKICSEVRRHPSSHHGKRILKGFEEKGIEGNPGCFVYHLWEVGMAPPWWLVRARTLIRIKLTIIDFVIPRRLITE